ncbi:MAG: DedA family protein [Patescibacteria group bacterium]|nr:DedA family protein [Patescibacteria group bacterium]MDE2172769.1 DedA family protein [Patescibacteria group bacterium]
MNLQHALMYLVTNYPILVYGVIMLSSYLEGPILALLCGIFYRLGYFHLVPVYFALMAGDLIGDCFWYYMGYRFGHRFISRFGKYVSIREADIAKVERIFHAYKDTILLVSKLTMGLGFALVTLFTAGMVRIPFKRYIALNVMGQFVWTALLLTIGYLFGHLYVSFNNVLARVSLVSLFVIVIFLLFGFGKYVRSRISKTA